MQEKYHAAKDELENLRKQLAKPGAPRKKQKLSLWQMFAELFKSNSSRKGGKIVKTEDNVSMEVLEMPEAQESAPAPITFGELLRCLHYGDYSKQRPPSLIQHAHIYVAVLQSAVIC